MPSGVTSLDIRNTGEDEAGEASSAAAVVARVVAVLGSSKSEVAVLVQSGRVERAGWWRKLEHSDTFYDSKTHTIHIYVFAFSFKYINSSILLTSLAKK